MAAAPYPSDRALDIIIPFYRNADLVAPLFRSFEETLTELKDLACTIVAVNDSPDDLELERALTAATNALSSSLSCRVIRNERNLGFVRSVNGAARKSVAARHDVVLLNSDTIVFPGAMREIQRVADCDPLIGFVSPRSNNATICTFPAQEEFQHIAPSDSNAIFRQICSYLPEFHFVPTAVGFCLYVKLEVLEEFGFFDETYGAGYNEENDLIMRANRCGYRAALANRAFVYHIGESSFSTSSSPKQSLEEKNAALLRNRYPEYTPSVNKYFNSEHYQAERLITGLLPDRTGRLDLVFDFSSVGPYHNGTFEACKEILVRATRTWRQFNLFVMASEEAIRFHRLDELERIFFISPTTQRKFALAFRFGQPFDYEQLFRMSRIAPLNVYGMLDPIAYDCLYLNNVDLDAIWGAVFAHADGVIYISDFVEEQFRRRFRCRAGLREQVTYLSLDYRDYINENEGRSPDGSYILVVGNAFAHKRVPATVDALSNAFPRDKLVVLGLPEDHRQNVISYQSGNLSEKQMDQLLRGARFVVFPSVYEGFGIPVVKSLAYRKPVMARSIPTNCAIKEKLGENDNFILYSSTGELVERLQRGFPQWKGRGDRFGDTSGGWDAIAEQIGRFLCEVSRSVSFSDVLVPRLQHMRLLEEKEQLRSRARAALSKSPAPDNAGIAHAGPSLAELDQAIAALRAREAQIEDIYHSWSWRITAPMRRLAEIYLGFKRKT
jgi:GT2 family glycosyltransferase/glycosyltransferase involved in cell wall biosynthesis